MKTASRILALVTSAAIATAALLTVKPAVAATLTSDASEKEEVIYATLSAGGSVDAVYAVNIFGSGSIVDYGDYRSVEMLNTTDPIYRDGDRIFFSTGADRVYYKGRLKTTDLPWDIAVQYSLDGKPVEPAALAGQSGALKIEIRIRPGSRCGSFAEQYALQTALTLDTRFCHNIEAPGATIANVGGKQQISYILLPGKSASWSITADAANFEMDSMAFNGIPLNIDLDVDDKDLMEQVSALQQALEALDDGAADLNGGLSALQDGAQTELKTGVERLQNGAAEMQDHTATLRHGGQKWQDGASTLQQGADELDAGMQNLNDGISQMETAIQALKDQSPHLTGGSGAFQSALADLQSALNQLSLSTDQLARLRSASSELKAGAAALSGSAAALQTAVDPDAYQAAMAQNGLDLARLKQENEAAVAGLDSLTAGLRQQASAMQAAGADTSALNAQIDQLGRIGALITASQSGLDGAVTYLDAAQQQISALRTGADDLATNTDLFDQQIAGLLEQISWMSGQMSAFSDAVDTLKSNYDQLDSGVQAYAGAVDEIASGYTRISEGSAQLAAGSQAFNRGFGDLCGKTGELLTGISQFYDAAGTLRDGSGQLNDGVAECLAGIAQLYRGSDALKNGTGQLLDKTGGMDAEIQQKIRTLLDKISGGHSIRSFISEKNTRVKRLQFVIKTESIRAAAAGKPVAEETKRLTFWEKLVNLFK